METNCHIAADGQPIKPVTVNKSSHWVCFKLHSRTKEVKYYKLISKHLDGFDNSTDQIYNHRWTNKVEDLGPLEWKSLGQVLVQEVY